MRPARAGWCRRGRLATASSSSAHRLERRAPRDRGVGTEIQQPQEPTAQLLADVGRPRRERVRRQRRPGPERQGEPDDDAPTARPGPGRQPTRNARASTHASPSVSRAALADHQVTHPRPQPGQRMPQLATAGIGRGLRPERLEDLFDVEPTGWRRRAAVRAPPDRPTGSFSSSIPRCTDDSPSTRTIRPCRRREERRGERGTGSRERRRCKRPREVGLARRSPPPVPPSSIGPCANARLANAPTSPRPARMDAHASRSRCRQTSSALEPRLRRQPRAAPRSPARGHRGGPAARPPPATPARRSRSRSIARRR